jgi:hypothetical protein
MYYIIYKITNNINGRYYIGRHATKDINDSYMGKHISRGKHKGFLVEQLTVYKDASK